MKKNVKNVNEKQENMRLNSVNSRKITSLQTCDWLKITKHFARSKNFILFFVYIKCISY